MPQTFNRLTILGHLGCDPEFRVRSERRYCVLTICTNDYTGNKETALPTWFKVYAWGKVAEVCRKYLRKGSYVFLEARIMTNKYTDAKGNSRRGSYTSLQSIQFFKDNSPIPVFEDLRFPSIQQSEGVSERYSQDEDFDFSDEKRRKARKHMAIKNEDKSMQTHCGIELTGHWNEFEYVYDWTQVNCPDCLKNKGD
ncbi:MAG: single-stranded DNA-binding protein [Oligoflexia bacterium]|nr:single-stranded DNA-binding protein [Oligoflexia bacterium]